MQFENCCGECWCCFKRKLVLDGFEIKGFNSFNSKVKGWKLMNDLNRFEIFSLDPVQFQLVFFISAKKNGKFIIKRCEFKI